MSWGKYLVVVFVIYATRKVLEFRANARKLSHLPGLRSIFSPASPFGTLIPTYFWNPGLSWQWRWRGQIYSKYRVQTMSAIPYLSGSPSIYTSSMEVARQVVSVKGQFEKPEETSLLMLLWGRNLFTENGSEWSRHRRIMNPAFTPDTYSLVWVEAASLYQEMLQCERLTDSNEKMVPVINDLTTKFALILIARCGFGQSISWNTPPQSSGMPLGEALVIVSGSSIVRLVTPRWMYKLPIKRLRDIETAYTDLAAFMETLISTRREELATEGKEEASQKDVFRLMIRASEGEGNLRMTDSELSGNTFLMLFAGHETTAKALDATIGFLALYEDIQEEVYQEILAEISRHGQLNFKSHSQLIKVQSSFVEAARLYRMSSCPLIRVIFIPDKQAAGFMMIRETTETVVLKTDEEDGHGGQIILPPGTRVIVDVVGLHYNPKNFPDPEEFRPSRWYNAPESDMTMFSMGPRACIGRKFALAEGVAFLAHLLRDFKLHVVLDPRETKNQWRARVMKGISAMTLGVGKIPVKLTRR
ncbi:cytochrome P450 [Mycena haematopus]|nr:cytochrome P450 [Mycena haematopus]